MNEQAIFIAALQEEPANRNSYLDKACGANELLRQRVEKLLAAYERAGSFLNVPIVAGLSPSPADGPTGSVEPDAGTTAEFGSDPHLTSDHPGRNEQVGSILGGKYKLIEEIGEGGMGSVYMAQQTEPVKRAVAIKVIKAGMDSKGVLARFDAERQALAIMDHPNIARVLDAGTTESGRPYFVMELVKGVPITRYCDERKLTPRQRLELFVPVCQAIQHAHQKGIIHRDIKPSNVLVAMYDDRPVPKVIDFGVAKAAGQPLTERTLMTGFGAVVGTPEYMSPEQASFNQMDVDTRSDVYALGVLLYELVAGSPPFSHKELEQAGLLEIFRVIREKEPMRPSNRLSTSDGLPALAANRGTEPRRLTALVKGELDWIVMKALEKDRGRRYDTANGFAADVQRFLAGEAVQAVPPSGWYRLKKMLRRNRGPVVAAGIILFVLVSGIIGTTIGLINAEAAKRQAQHERDDKEQARREAEDARNQAEYQAASNGIDRDMAGNPEPKIELLRLARRLPSIADHALDLREFVIRRMLILGQQIQPLGQQVEPLSRDVNQVTVILGQVVSPFFNNIQDISPDGRFLLRRVGATNALREIFSGRELAIWRSHRGWEGPSFVAQGRLILEPGMSDERASYGPGHEVELRDTEGHRKMRTAPLCQNYRQVWVSSDGSRVLTVAGYDRQLPQSLAVQLWDGRTGKLVAELPGHKDNLFSATLSPDGTTILTASDGCIRVWSSADGRLLRELVRFPPSNVNGSPYPEPIRGLSFSPDGKYVGAIATNHLHNWHVENWLAEEPLALLSPTQQDNPGEIAWLDEATPSVVYYYSKQTLVKGIGAIPKILVKKRGNLALIEDGGIYDFELGRMAPISHDRKVAPAAAAFAYENRYLYLPKGADAAIYDVVIDKPLFQAGKSVSIKYMRNLGGRWAVLGWREEPRRGLAHCGCILLPLALLPDAKVMVLWANVVSRGELDRAGEFVPWKENRWEEHRHALAQMLPEDNDDVLLRPAIRDRLFWLKHEIMTTGAANPKGDFLYSASLIDRLVVSEPNWENYTIRARNRNYSRQFHLAMQDAFEASRLAGVLIDPFDQYQPAWELGLQPQQPRDHYELALRWEETRRAAGAEYTSYTMALALYRLGRYSESLALLRQEEEKGYPVQVGRALLNGFTAATSPPHRLAAEAYSPNQPPNLLENGFPALWALCHFKLGLTDQAQTHLAAAELKQKEFAKTPPPGRPGDDPDPPPEAAREIPLYREAVETITGKQPS